MERAEIFSKVVAIVKPFSKDEAALNNVSDETRIIQDLKVNSARFVDIVLAFEDAFGIEIDDDAADKTRTIGDAVALIVAKQK